MKPTCRLASNVKHANNRPLSPSKRQVISPHQGHGHKETSSVHDTTGSAQHHLQLDICGSGSTASICHLGGDHTVHGLERFGHPHLKIELQRGPSNHGRVAAVRLAETA